MLVFKPLFTFFKCAIPLSIVPVAIVNIMTPHAVPNQKSKQKPSHGISYSHLRQIDWALAHTACSSCRKQLCRWSLQNNGTTYCTKAKIKTKTLSWHIHLLSLNIDTHGSNLLSYFKFHFLLKLTNNLKKYM